MLMPKRVRHGKQFRGSMAGKTMRGNRTASGPFGLVVQEPCWVRSSQAKTAHVALTRYTERGDRIWVRIFPDRPATAKLAETRMGSGKGSTKYWMAIVKPGRVLFGIGGIAEADAREALRLIMYKLPCECKIAPKEEANAGVDGVSAVTAEGDEQSEDE